MKRNILRQDRRDLDQIRYLSPAVKRMDKRLIVNTIIPFGTMSNLS